MKYRAFNTEAEALADEAAIWADMEPHIVEVRAGLGVSPRVTQRWAPPIQLTDGRWAFPSPDETGEVIAPELFITE
jgi:hypothetical protein